MGAPRERLRVVRIRLAIADERRSMSDAHLRQLIGPCGTRSVRRWVFVAPDQLHLQLGALRATDPATTGVVLLESREWLSRRPYHRMRVAVILLNQRNFAVELVKAGFEVDYRIGDEPMVDMLGAAHKAHGTLHATEWAEREMRAEFEPLRKAGALQVVPHDGWVTLASDFEGCRRGTQWSMDAFYRAVRKRTGILMEPDGTPAGGQFSFDVDNRKPWKGKPSAPAPPRFDMDPMRMEVQQCIERTFAKHPGELDMQAIAGTHAECEAMWTWAMTHCLEHFGPYEDAMSVRSSGLFHSRMSPLMNFGRMPALRMVKDVLAMQLPIASKEGFIRQVIGWREFVRWVHLATDGFRDAWPVAAHPGDGGFAGWSGARWSTAGSSPEGVDGGAQPHVLGDGTPLPPAFWGAASGMHCLDRVVADVWREGWSHHITRLMVLGNLGTLLDVQPRALADWFWVAYMDAWDWVVEPNVLAMATYGTGGVMTTKPYVAGSAYIDRMSDYCQGCAFKPDRDCPITPMYWAFLGRHAEKLQANPRMKLVMAAWRKRSSEQKARDQATFVHVRDVLVKGQRLVPQTSLFAS